MYVEEYSLLLIYSECKCESLKSGIWCDFDNNSFMLFQSSSSCSSCTSAHIGVCVCCSQWCELSRVSGCCPVHSRLCLGRCGMLRGLTWVPQPVLASQPLIQLAGQPASRTDRQAERQAGTERGRTQLLSRPPLSSTIYWFTLWDFSFLAWDHLWTHTSTYNPTYRHRRVNAHLHTCKQRKWSTHIWTAVGWSW